MLHMLHLSGIHELIHDDCLSYIDRYNSLDHRLFTIVSLEGVLD